MRLTLNLYYYNSMYVCMSAATIIQWLISFVCKVNRISILSQNLCFHGCIWSIGYVDSKYDIVNNVLWIFVVVYIKLTNFKIVSETWFQRVFCSNWVADSKYDIVNNILWIHTRSEGPNCRSRCPSKRSGTHNIKWAYFSGKWIEFCLRISQLI